MNLLTDSQRCVIIPMEFMLSFKLHLRIKPDDGKLQ